MCELTTLACVTTDLALSQRDVDKFRCVSVRPLPLHVLPAKVKLCIVGKWAESVAGVCRAHRWRGVSASIIQQTTALMQK